MSTVTDASTSGTPSVSAGVLTVRETGLAPLQAPLLPPTYSGGDSLDGAIDYARVWHAFRRRWPSAVTLGLLLATLASVPVWLFFPRTFEAAVWLRVRDKSGMLTGGSRDNAEYEAYRKTQLQLIKSPSAKKSILSTGSPDPSRSPHRWIRKSFRCGCAGKRPPMRRNSSMP
jgi:hypothetical protein